MVRNGRICNKQQNIFGNQGISVYSKLQKRIENRNRHQEKRKSRESNGICRKNKEGLERSWDGIKKSLKIDEEIGG